ncbi:hypothetical protein FCIRC_6392 [Fusarium circinatum]|uniref:Uncharacterized protein n=1 Tax=Fusarium circinatum TaxID=48490 RepID=A0A8H5U024_FUSCI|nr:hypothetical protein FCIRC_6392 [Fusarium circinatum]
MSASQNNTGGDASGYKLSGFISDPAEAEAMYNKLVEETGCTDVIFEFTPAPDDQGVTAENGNATVGAANSNISAENPSAENDSSTKK